MNNKNYKVISTCPECKLDLVNGLTLITQSSQDPNLSDPDQECSICASEQAQLSGIMKCPVCGYSQLSDEHTLLH